MASKEKSQQTSLLDILKKKMRQAREEAENAKDEADEMRRKLEGEQKKREEVSFLSIFLLKYFIIITLFMTNEQRIRNIK